uniref:Eukaryotic initiation factor iso-4F subunit p82-34 n=1 Tax=Sipha flava TaxID=143950 RepID=A0A2S2QL40_9HEMI
MTSANFKLLTEELLFNITTVEHLEKTIQLILEMVFYNPKSIPIYVYIYCKLENIERSYNSRFNTGSFKRQLLTQCEDLLHSGMIENKINSRGIYTFIGKLYLKNMLPYQIIVDYLNWSLDKESLAYVENVCYFLIIVGKKLDKSYNLKETTEKMKLQFTSKVLNVWCAYYFYMENFSLVGDGQSNRLPRTSEQFAGDEGPDAFRNVDGWPVKGYIEDRDIEDVSMVDMNGDEFVSGCSSDTSGDAQGDRIKS